MFGTLQLTTNRRHPKKKWEASAARLSKHRRVHTSLIQMSYWLQTLAGRPDGGRPPPAGGR